MGYLGCAVLYDDGDSLRLHRFFCDGEFHDAGLCIQGLGLVKDKVPDTVVDPFPLVVFYGLQRMRVMANECVGSGINKPMSLHSLSWHRLQGMFAAPV